MIKLTLGSIVSALAMMIAAFIYFAGPLALTAYSVAGEAQSAAVQSVLAANLPETGTYMVPDPSTQSGTILFGKGPVATVHYNSSGFALDSADGMIWGLVLYLIVSVLIAGALSQLDRRIPDFKSRAIVVVLFSLAGSVLMTLGDPIWLHQDWTYAIFEFVGNSLILIIGGLILARWFMPTKAELTQTPANASLPVQKPEEASSAPEIAVVDRPGL